MALSELLGGEWGGLTPSKASITIRHEMALALFEKELICKKVMWLWEGKRRIFGVKTERRPPFLFVIGDPPHVCEAAFRLLTQMRNTETSWRTMNRAVGVYAYIVLTALNVFQPNKHFITAASSTVAALLHQQKMFGS